MEFSEIVKNGVPYYHNDSDLRRLLEACSYLKGEEQKQIAKAFYLAKEAHEGQEREGGEPYFIHPFTVAFYASYFQLSSKLIIGCLLHDTVEDTSVTLDDISLYFGEEVRDIVDSVTKLNSFSSKEMKIATNTSELFRSFLHLHPEAFILKLLDRVHNMSTIDKKKNRDKQIENSNETLQIFVPMARNLGCGLIRDALEDRSIHCLNPEKYFQIEQERDQIEQESLPKTQDLIASLQQHLNQQNIPVSIRFQMKQIYAIYQALNRNLSYEQMHDLRVVKMTVPTVLDCYASLQSIHQVIAPIQNRMKDYIASPKMNKYQAFHTTGHFQEDLQYQIQIKTQEMTDLAEKGICVYDNQPNTTMQKELEHFEFYKLLKSLEELVPDDMEFYQALKKHILRDRICITLSDGTKHELPKNSTVLDLICSLGLEDLFHFSKALCNGKPVTLGTALKNEDNITLYSRMDSVRPNRTMIRDCKTPYAKKLLTTIMHL